MDITVSFVAPLEAGNYKTYWMRVLAVAAEPNPQQAMQSAADDALARIEALMGTRKV